MCRQLLIERVMTANTTTVGFPVSPDCPTPSREPAVLSSACYSVTCPLQMFLAMEKGEHISPRYPCISWFRVRAFRIEPLTSKGRLTVDGELVDYVPLQQHVWHKAANVFCSPE